MESLFFNTPCLDLGLLAPCLVSLVCHLGGLVISIQIGQVRFLTGALHLDFQVLKWSKMVEVFGF